MIYSYAAQNGSITVLDWLAGNGFRIPYFVPFGIEGNMEIRTEAWFHLRGYRYRLDFGFERFR